MGGGEERGRAVLGAEKRDEIKRHCWDIESCRLGPCSQERRRIVCRAGQGMVSNSGFPVRLVGEGRVVLETGCGDG